MGELEKKIQDGLKGAIKARDEIRTSTLRMLTAAMNNLVIEKKAEHLDDEDIIKLVKKQVKQHQESIESFKKGNRTDLVEKETKELEILNAFLPQEMSEKEIEEIVKNVISRAGASSKADIGKVMKLSMQELKGRADGKAVNAIAQRLLP